MYGYRLKLHGKVTGSLHGGLGTLSQPGADRGGARRARAPPPPPKKKEKKEGRKGKERKEKEKGKEKERHKETVIISSFVPT